MALPNIHRKLFQSEGAAAMLREDILPDHDFSYLGKAVHGSHVCSDNLPEGSEVSTGGAGYDMGSGGLMVFYQGLKLILGEQYEEVESGEAVIINFAAEEGAVFDFESHGGWEYEVPVTTFRYTVAPQSTDELSYCPINPSYMTSGSITIHWGDGEVDKISAGDSTDFPVHAYSTDDGTRYQITLDAEVGVWAGVKAMMFGNHSSTATTSGEPEPLAEDNAGAKVRYLVSVDSRIPKTAMTDLQFMFYESELLESVPSDLFQEIAPNVTSLTWAFRECESLKNISGSIFENMTAVTSATYVFFRCSALQSIPSGLFKDLKSVTAMSYALNRAGAPGLAFDLDLTDVPSISNARYFAYQETSENVDNRIVRVKSGTTTENSLGRDTTVTGYCTVVSV